jgi:competence protein ComEA
MQTIAVSRRQALVAALVVIGLLAVAGRHFTRVEPPTASTDAEPVAAIAASERAKLVVHVVGAVRRPGLYRLTEGSRIADAVRRAGGATKKADLASINLAATIADGVQVLVPRRLPPATTAGSSGTNTSEASGPVALSSATVEQLDALPCIGPVTAQKILDYRDEHGAFSSVDELDGVPGIGPKRLEELREVVTP